MAKKKAVTQTRMPFNLLGEDAELAFRLLHHLETKMGTRLSRMQMARMAIAAMAKREGVK